MNTTRLSAVLLGGFLLWPAGAMAQSGHEHGPEGPTPQGMMGAKGAHPHMACQMMAHGSMRMEGSAVGPAPRIILEQREELGLDQAQIEGLEESSRELVAAQEAYKESRRALEAELEEVLASDAPDLSRYESTLRQMAMQGVDYQVQAARFQRRAVDVLTKEQRAALSSQRHSGHGTRGMMQGMMRSGTETEGHSGRDRCAMKTQARDSD